MTFNADLIAGGITVFGLLAVAILVILNYFADDWPKGGRAA